jgi:DNA-binding transcriptional regulator/RsmH inhibitor MraZ
LFVGRHVRQLDEKGRLAIPAEYLELLDGPDREALYITPGKQGCIWLVPPSYYQGDFVRGVAASFEGGLPDQFFHVCQRRTLDKAGRILVDQDARDLAGLAAPVGAEKVTLVVCGSGRYLQVWNKPDYDARALPARQVAQNIPGSGNAFGAGARP